MYKIGIVSFQYKCPYCSEDALLAVEIESPSDYSIMDDACPECAHLLPDGLDVSSSVIDFYAFQADIER